jgi:hypothetical protein
MTKKTSASAEGVRNVPGHNMSIVFITYRTRTTTSQLINILFFRAETLKLTSIPYIVINLMLKTESKYGRLIKLRAVFSRYTNKNTCEVISPYISPYANGGFFLVH